MNADPPLLTHSAPGLCRHAARPATATDRGHGRLHVNRPTRRVWLSGVEVPLKPREFDLLWHLVQHPSRVFTRGELLTDVWGHDIDVYEHTVSSHIHRLRDKLGDTRSPAQFIHTVWGVGYRFEVVD